MSLVNRSKYIKILLVLVLLVSSTLFTNAAAARDVTDQVEDIQERNAHYYDLGDKVTIGIIYDPINELTNNSATSLFYSLSLMTPNVELIQARHFYDIQYILDHKDLELAVYIFPSTYKNLQITQRGSLTLDYSWNDMSELLSNYDDTHHIFAMGNSKQILQQMPFSSNIHGSNQELVDAKHMFIYSLWTISDILEQYYSNEAANLAYDIKMASMEFFANNFNDIIVRNMDTNDPLGTEHPDTIKQREAQFFNEHPERAERIPREGNVIDQELNREVDPITGELADYQIDIVSDENLTPGEFILQLLPLDSGLRGPIGGIVDKLLSVLFKFIGGKIGLSEDTVQQIVTLFTQIPDFIGAIKDPSSNKMKEFLSDLKPLLPIPESMNKYFDLIVEALFLLRGDFDDIKNFIFEALKLVVPDDFTIAGKNPVDLLKSIFDLGASAISSIQSGDNIIDVIFSVMNENIVKNLTSSFLGNGSLFGISSSNVPDVVENIIGGVGVIVNFISTGEITGIIKDYGPKLMDMVLSSVYPSLNNSRIGRMVMLGTSLLLVATGIIKDTTITDILVDLFKEVFPDVDNVEKLETAGRNIVGNITKLIEGGINLSDLQSKVTTAFNEIGIDTTAFSQAIDSIKNIVSMIAALKDDGLTLSGSVTITSAITGLLNQVGVVDTDIVNTINDITGALLGIVNFFKNPPNLKKIISNIVDALPSPQEILTKLITVIIQFATGTPTTSFSLDAMGVDEFTGEAGQLIEAASQGIALIFEIINSAQGNSIEGVLMTLLQGATFLITQFTDFDITAYVEVGKAIFGQILDLAEEPPSFSELIDKLGELASGFVSDEVKQLIEFLFLIKDIFTGGFKTVFGKLTEWLAGQVTKLIESLTGGLDGILSGEPWNFLDLDIPIGIGSFSLFSLNVKLGLEPGFEFDAQKFGEMIFDLVFKGVSLFEDVSDFGGVLRELFSFFSIIPIFVAEIRMEDFGSDENGFLQFMLQSLGVELSFSGYGFFKLMLFSFKNGVFNFDDFFKVVEWGFGFTLTISRTFTLLDFLTGGAGGGLNAIGKYIGLDAISITIAFTLGLDVVKRAATANKPETGSLTITLGIAFTVSLGIDILIAKLILTGTFEIILTLLQDLVNPSPMRVFISIELIITVTIGFLFWDWDFDYHWSPSGFSPDDPHELTPSTPEEAVDQGALGGDSDSDGLSDEYENNTPGLNPFSVDSDGDGLDDKFESQTLKTDPGSNDTDLDGLLDLEEYNIKTNPLAKDSDFDGLSDYEEVVIYGTDPLAFDTDEDGLDDKYEITFQYNMTGITASVSEIMIGGQPYDDRTDPLNPDTDGDGLFDGEEGSRGLYYGPELYNTTEQENIDGTYTPDPFLYFNGGYTHPLDNDTDDDSYWQLYDGSIAPVQKKSLTVGTGIDLTDFGEIFGNEIIFIDPDTGEPETPRIIRTNPVMPDSDGDTGVTEQERQNPPFGEFLNSDGYELTRKPPTDPLDADTDDDGLIDGYEGVLKSTSNHTDANNPDTDGDGLGDLQENLLGSNPRSVDTDGDGVTDGDEFFIFATNPFLADTDSDGLEDGEELWFYHSNPHVRDTDKDGLLDYDEVWVYFSKPADEDSDNDGLTDYEEIKIHYTDPFLEDTDGDGLFDGEEVEGLIYYVEINGTLHNYTIYTDPTKWDTDGDSLLTPDQYGNISQSMNDYDEWLLGTDPTRTDTDMDGIKDGWEMWVGQGLIPDFDPQQLNPLSNDTDNDGLLDGEELIIANTSTLLNPYIGFYAVTPYNTSADNADSDGDNLLDGFELKLGTLPSNNDTDNDTLSDYAEFMIYGTSPIKNDTDGDELLDPEELFGYEFPANTSARLGIDELIFTDANNSDSDGDLLPDGAEVYFYLKDPRNQDENNNDILDGMEIDTDSDGLYDGEEYYIYRTAEAPDGGGINDPDSDKDGLFDGFEVYATQTDASNWDTDNDTYSDGLEYHCGTNPLDNETTTAEMETCFSTLSRLIILSPVSKTYNTNAIPVIAYDSDETMVSMEYRYKKKGSSSWSSSVDMTQDAERGPGYWIGTYLSLPLENGTFILEITGEKPGGSTVTRQVEFKLFLTPYELEIISPKAQKYEFNAFEDPILPVEVVAGANYTQVWFRMKYENGTILSGNQSLTYEAGLGSYYLSEYEFPDIGGEQTYAIEVFAERTDGAIVVRSNQFIIKTPTLMDNIITFGGPVAGVSIIVGTAQLIRKGKFKNPFKKGGS